MSHSHSHALLRGGCLSKQRLTPDGASDSVLWEVLWPWIVGSRHGTWEVLFVLWIVRDLLVALRPEGVGRGPGIGCEVQPLICC